MLLSQEGFLISAFLAQGLTALRAAGAHDKGALYRASFQLSIGIERMMKVIAIIHHMGENSGSPPTGREIKDRFGHDFPKLSGAVMPISARIDGDPLGTVLADPLNRRIFDLLGEFGKGDIRYFNLEALAATPPELDPLSKWHLLFDEIVEHDVPKRRKAMAIAQALMIGSLIDQTATVIMHDLQGSALTGRTLVERRALEGEAARYAVWRVMQLLFALKRVLDKVTHTAMYGTAPVSKEPRVPYMHEFFPFVVDDWSLVKNKKRWP